jgi:dihydrofolate reductase
MRKIVMSNWVTVDGFFAGPNGELDWIIQDPEVNKAMHELMHADTMLLGKVTYQMFENSWPHMAKDPNVPKEVRTQANEVIQMTKVVFSKTLNEVTWENSKLFNRNLVEEVKKLKQGKGTDIAIFGSGTIVKQLANEGLIDEYVIVVTPVVLGVGKLLFNDVKKFNLKSLEAKNFDSGNILLHYKFALA